MCNYTCPYKDVLWREPSVWKLTEEVIKILGENRGDSLPLLGSCSVFLNLSAYQGWQLHLAAACSLLEGVEQQDKKK